MTTNVVETAVRRSVVAVVVVCLVSGVALLLRPASSQPTAARNDAHVASGTPGSTSAGPSQVSTPAGRGGVISVPLVTGSTRSTVSSGTIGAVTSRAGRHRGHSGGRSSGGAGAGKGPAAPARVTGLSLLLDYVNNTSGLGFPTVYQLGTSTIFAVIPVQDLPKAAQSQLFKVVNLPTSAYDKFASNGPAAIAFARKMFGPLSTYNGPSNALVGVLANTLDRLGTQYAGITGPFNQMLVGFATLITAAKAPVPR